MIMYLTICSSAMDGVHRRAVARNGDTGAHRATGDGEGLAFHNDARQRR